MFDTRTSCFSLFSTYRSPAVDFVAGAAVVAIFVALAYL
jgi:hypothetical protein